jgi:CDP-glycerol glycerophosphotransferase
MPLVSVVVIGYNDAEHLPTAVRSVMAQTMRDLEILVVDDASTDDTPAVTARLAAADPRVRVIRLDTNSGGCSRPRNVGIDQATGRYVMFLDSDDVFTRRACQLLVAAAERADADLACGRFVRRHHQPRRVIGAHEQLYLRPVVLDSILDRPRQLYDTPAWNKLYRRQLLLDQGLRFPEGLLYEDLLFTTEAYCTARRIAIIPELVYVWNVRRNAEAPSITNRGEVRNWRDRFEVHRRIDAFLAAHEVGPALAAAKQTKFLDADFALFLRQLRTAAPSQRPELLALAEAYVAGLDLAASPDAAAPSRVGAALAARGDLERTLCAADWSVTGGVGGDLTLRDDRLFWTAAHLDDPSTRAALDVTATGLLTAGFAGTPFRTVVRECRVDGTDLLLTGDVHDVLGRLAREPVITGRVEVRGRIGGVLWQTPAVLRPAPENLLGFEARLDLVALGRRLAAPTVGHELRLALVLSSAGRQNRLALSARDARLPDHDLAVATRWHRLTGGRLRPVEINGRFVLQLAGLPATYDRVIGLLSRGRYAGRRFLLRRRRTGRVRTTGRR